MHDAGLHDRLGEDRVDRLWKALQAVNHGDDNENVANPRFRNSFMTRSQNLAPSEVSIHRPRMSFVPSGAKRDIDGLVAHEPLDSP